MEDLSELKSKKFSSFLNKTIILSSKEYYSNKANRTNEITDIDKQRVY